MLLEGSCHCASIRFSVNSPHPYPFNYCYCTICRKTAGGGGFAINLGAENDSLKVEGESFVSVYQAMITGAQSGKFEQSPCQRNFCRLCSAALWVWDPRWPELIHPFASAIDTELPLAPEHTHLMLDFKAPWVEVKSGPVDTHCPLYPEESIAEWHQRLSLQK